MSSVKCFIDDDSSSPQSAAGIPNHVLSSRGYFFDNPRRYDSDDDLAWSIPPQNASARYEFPVGVLLNSVSLKQL